MRDAAETFRRPPEPPIRRDVGGRSKPRRIWSGALAAPARRSHPPRGAGCVSAWIGIAATLVIGIGIGRGSTMLASGVPLDARRGCRAHVGADPRTIRHLDRARTRSRRRSTSDRPPRCSSRCRPRRRSGRTDQQFASRAGDLLTRTRLLMDSPAANDPAMRDLLEDLELVLMQVVRLQSTQAVPIWTSSTARSNSATSFRGCAQRSPTFLRTEETSDETHHAHHDVFARRRRCRRSAGAADPAGASGAAG